MADDCRIISMVKGNPFTAANQVTNTLQVVGISISKPPINLKNRKARLDFAKKKQHLKTVLEKHSLYKCQSDGKKKV